MFLFSAKLLVIHQSERQKCFCGASVRKILHTHTNTAPFLLRAACILKKIETYWSMHGRKRAKKNWWGQDCSQVEIIFVFMMS